MLGMSKDSAVVGGVDSESLLMGVVGGGVFLFSMHQDQPPHPPPPPGKQGRALPGPERPCAKPCRG